jgi:NADH:ubiquinone oxidoreductase subunit 2 (subunit N)
MGLGSTQSPTEMRTRNISNFALCGIPFSAGFYSKDFIFGYIFYGVFEYIWIFVCLCRLDW